VTTARQLTSKFKLGRHRCCVVKAMDSSEDPYILKGSCGVDYRFDSDGDGRRRSTAPGGCLKNPKKPRVKESQFRRKVKQERIENRLLSKQSFGSMLYSHHLLSTPPPPPFLSLGIYCISANDPTYQ